jgi:hypothetical protein
MLKEFDSEFNGHLRQFQHEVDFRYYFSRITSANLECEYEELFRFFFFQYHTEGSASIDILAIDDGQLQKWLQQLLDYVNDIEEWGKYEQYELSEIRSILNDILVSKETGEYLQEKTETEQELKMIEEAARIYGEKYDLLEQYDDDKHRRECHDAKNDLADIIERVHKRIKYIYVEGEIIEPASSILKKYALNARIAFDIESVRTSILKINHWFNITELSDKLREMYTSAQEGEQVTNIYLFGIKYAALIKESPYSIADILEDADLPKSYQTEVNKGIKLSDDIKRHLNKEINKLSKGILAEIADESMIQVEWIEYINNLLLTHKPAAPRRALGRGLQAILGDEPQTDEHQTTLDELNILSVKQMVAQRSQQCIRELKISPFELLKDAAFPNASFNVMEGIIDEAFNFWKSETTRNYMSSGWSQTKLRIEGDIKKLEMSLIAAKKRGE